MNDEVEILLETLADIASRLDGLIETSDTLSPYAESRLRNVSYTARKAITDSLNRILEANREDDGLGGLRIRSIEVDG